ncbi:MAG: hypothetical protein K2X82_25690, partial [Gemmataceae bacterium]|nr:hypothetical protein [Gemmataceae bacterium]
MNPRRPAALVVLLALAAPAAAAPPDPAALFPADTLAYAELHDPAAVAPDLAALVRGSALDDIVGYVHKKRDGTTEPRDLQKDEIALLGLVASPEFAAELPRLRVAAGLLGFTDRGEPRWAVAVLTGDSPAAGLVAKGFLATADGLRKVGAVGDVPVFQYRQPMYVYDQAENRQKLDTTNAPAEGAHEPTFATVPGLFVVGTDKAAIGELVNRFRGKGGAALAGAATYREATAHRRPGLFVYADARAFAAAHTNALKAAGRGTEPDALGWFKLVADVRAVRYVAGVVQVRDGGLAVSAVTAFEPGKASPLLTILGGPAADAGLLRYAPGPAAVAVAAALPEAGRAAAVVGFLDALAKAGGGLGPLPSDRVKELDAKYGTKSADELAARLRAVTVVLPAKQELPKGAAPLPTLVLHADGPDAAAAWLAFLPRLAGHVAKTDPPQPATEAIGGVKVYSLPAAGMPGNSPIHYAAKGAAVAIGQDRAVVAAAVAGG